MSEKIKVDIISDVVCPWCIIGYKRLEQAISEMGIQDRVELEWQPFELNPRTPAEGEDIQEHVAKKYGTTPEESIRSRINMSKLGEELGVRFDFFDGKKIVNTRGAHILLDFAKEFGRQTELKMRLYEAYFSERKDISDREVLCEEVQHVGLNVDEALGRLDNEAARERIRDQEAHWYDLGVSSVPTVVFNGSSALTGAQPVEVFKQVLLI